MQRLTGAQVKMLRDALDSAYPTVDALRQMVRIGLDQDLDDIAYGEGKLVLIFDLITKWAEPNSQTADLIQAAVAGNPSNAELRVAAQHLGVTVPPRPLHSTDHSSSDNEDHADSNREQQRSQYGGTTSLFKLTGGDLLDSVGSIAYMTHHYEKALTAYTYSLDLRPDDPDTLINRGDTYVNMERYTEALADYIRSLALRPDDPDTLTNRGNTYNNMQRYAEALADYTRSLDLRPHDPDTLSDRGNTYYWIGQYIQALEDFDASLQMQADVPYRLLLRALTYVRLDNREAAQYDIDQATELAGDDPSILYNLACLHSLRGDQAAAFTTLEAAIAYDESNRALAQTDPDFAPMRDDPAFRALVGLPPNPDA